MSTITKWIIGICVLVVLAVGGYCALIWTQGQIFDRESSVTEVEFNGMVIHTKVNITEKDFFGRKFTMSTEIQDLPVVNHTGEVTFGWYPTAQLKVTGIPSDPILEKAVLEASPIITANFNVRFWPTQVFGTINPITAETKWGPVSLGKTDLDSSISYASNIFSQRAEIDSVIIKYASESFKEPYVTFGLSRLDASIWPKQPKMLNMDITLQDISDPENKLKINSFNFHTNLARKGSDYLQNYVLKTFGTEDILNKPSPFGLKGDVVAQWPQKINFTGLFSSIVTGGQTQQEITEKDLKNLIRAFREGKASIVINALEANAQGVNITGSGIVGDTKSQGVWADLRVNMKAEDLGRLGILTWFIPPSAYSKENHNEIDANIVVREDNDMLQLLCNGVKLQEWPAKSILKELY